MTPSCLSISYKSRETRLRQSGVGINSLSAILNHAYAELDVDKRNPFSRLFIRGEGQDAHKRGTFTLDQLKQGYEQLCRLDHRLSC
jgi:hypothetical protein